MEEKEYYTIPEACKIVGLCDATVRAMCKKGVIEGMTKIGSNFAIPNAWVKMNTLPDGFVSAPEASRLSGISRWGLQKAVDEGRVDSLRRIYSGDKMYIFVNISNSKWHNWVENARERRARYVK